MLGSCVNSIKLYLNWMGLRLEYYFYKLFMVDKNAVEVLLRAKQ